MAGQAARIIVAAIVVAFAAYDTRAAESHDQRFLEGLRERRLSELAAEFCQERLASQDLSPSEGAALAIELARCRAG